MDELETTAAPEKPKTAKPKPKKKKSHGRKQTKAQKARIFAKLKKKTKATVVRSERLDMRLSKAEKAKISAKAKKTRRTVTSLILEAIEKIR